MSRIAYVNGRYLPHDRAAVHIEDRGYQLADGVYEVCEVRGRRILDLDRHLDRLDRSLAALSIPWPMARASLAVVLAEVIRQNRIGDGIVYLQVTRGVAPRDHAFPNPAVAPCMVVTAKAMPLEPRETKARRGIAVVTVPDIRWGRVDIKTVGLLPNVLARQKSREAGAEEAWMIDRDGLVTEGASSNAWIVDAGGALVTRQADTSILGGIVRALLAETAGTEGLKLEQRPFSLAEAHAAREAFLTSTTNAVMPIVKIDGRPVGNGRPGPVSRRLRRALMAAEAQS